MLAPGDAHIQGSEVSAAAKMEDPRMTDVLCEICKYFPHFSMHVSPTYNAVHRNDLARSISHHYRLVTWNNDTI